MVTLKVTKRDVKTKIEAIRKQGMIPAVFYGRKEKSTPISISLIDFKKAYKAAGETSVINLDGEGIDVQALIHEIELDPVRNTPRHVDFYAVEKDKKVSIHVPIDFAGIAPAVKDLGGILVKVLHALEIEALPKDLPNKITVDISTLTALDSVIHAKDIKLDPGVALITKPEAIIASVAEVKEEVAEVVPVDVADIEISEKRGKEEVPADGAETPKAEGKAEKKA